MSPIERILHFSLSLSLGGSPRWLRFSLGGSPRRLRFSLSGSPRWWITPPLYRWLSSMMKTSVSLSTALLIKNSLHLSLGGSPRRRKRRLVLLSRIERQSYVILFYVWILRFMHVLDYAPSCSGHKFSNFWFVCCVGLCLLIMSCVGFCLVINIYIMWLLLICFCICVLRWMDQETWARFVKLEDHSCNM